MDTELITICKKCGEKYSTSLSFYEVRKEVTTKCRLCGTENIETLFDEKDIKIEAGLIKF